MIPPDTRTETYAALRLEIDNWRWQGVPFYLRSGKRLGGDLTEIALQLRPAPRLHFRRTATIDPGADSGEGGGGGRRVRHDLPQVGHHVGHGSLSPGRGVDEGQELHRRTVFGGDRTGDVDHARHLAQQAREVRERGEGGRGVRGARRAHDDGGHGLTVLERRRLLPRAGGLGRRQQEGGLVVRGDVADRAEHGAAQAEHGEPDHGERRGQAQPQPPRGTPRRGGGAEGGQVGRGGHAPERRGWFDDQTTMGAG